MTGYVCRTSVALAHAGEVGSLWLPYEPRSGYGVVLLHGAGVTTEFQASSAWASGRLAARIAMAGIPCIASEMAGDTYGNDTSQTRLAEAIAALAPYTASDAKVHLVGISMGGAVGLRYAAAHTGAVASYAGILPLLDISSAYSTNYGGVRAAIATAWGVVYPAPLPAGANIHTAAAALNGVVPSQVYYSSTDAIIDPARQITVAATMGADLTNVGANGHSELSISDSGNAGAGNWSKLTDFLIANGA